MNYLKELSLGDLSNNKVNAIVEIPIGTNAKYELSVDGTHLTCVRELHKRYKYPFNYGCLPQTFAGDKDPMDVIVINNEKLAPLTVVECTVVGVIKTLDNGLQDDKILAVPTYCKMSMREIKKKVRKIYHFLKVYKYPYNKFTKVFKPSLDTLEAVEVIKSASIKSQMVAINVAG